MVSKVVALVFFLQLLPRNRSFSLNHFKKTEKKNNAHLVYRWPGLLGEKWIVAALCFFQGWSWKIELSKNALNGQSFRKIIYLMWNKRSPVISNIWSYRQLQMAWPVGPGLERKLVEESRNSEGEAGGWTYWSGTKGGSFHHMLATTKGHSITDAELHNQENKITG